MPTKPKLYKIDFHTPEFMPSNIATNIIVQHFQENFKVSFYEIKPDIILSEEDKSKMEKRGTLRADCVGSFIISHGDFRKFIDVMQEQLNKYEKRTEETKESVLPSS